MYMLDERICGDGVWKRYSAASDDATPGDWERLKNKLTYYMMHCLPSMTRAKTKRKMETAVPLSSLNVLIPFMTYFRTDLDLKKKVEKNGSNL